MSNSGSIQMSTLWLSLGGLLSFDCGVKKRNCLEK